MLAKILRSCARRAKQSSQQTSNAAMPTYNKTMSLPYKPEQMFELVSEVERYPEFVRWVSALRVLNPQTEGSVQTCIGEAVVAFKGFTQTFATNVRADTQACTVDVSLVRGPLKHLKNKWTFEPDGEAGCKVHFDVDYDFNNFILRALARANHDLAVDRIMQTFLAEAQRRYGGQA